MTASIFYGKRISTIRDDPGVVFDVVEYRSGL